MEEVWKDIKGFEGRYRISNKGNVMNVKTNKILKYVKSPLGYATVRLYHGDVIEKYPFKNCMVHKLMGETFLPNPNKLKMINHIDENKMNPSIENLEWVSARENANHGNRNETISDKAGKAICQYNLNGKLLRIWKNSLKPAKIISAQSGADMICIGGQIRNACNGRVTQAYGYMWRDYEKDSVQQQIKHVKSSYKTNDSYRRSMQKIKKIKFEEKDILEGDLYNDSCFETSISELLDEIIANTIGQKYIDMLYVVKQRVDELEIKVKDMP